MTLNRDGFGMHTHYDTVELLSAWSLERSARLLAHIAESLSDIDSMPFPQNIPEEFKSSWMNILACRVLNERNL